jgi:hypothetical protein
MVENSYAEAFRKACLCHWIIYILEDRSIELPRRHVFIRPNYGKNTRIQHSQFLAQLSEALK